MLDSLFGAAMPHAPHPIPRLSLADLRRFARERRRSLLLVALVGILLAALIGWELRGSYKQARTAAQLGAQHLSLLLKEQLEGAFRETDLVLRELADKTPADQLMNLEQLPPAARRQLAESLSDRLPGLPQIDTLAVMPVRGQRMLTSEGWRPILPALRKEQQQLADNPGLELVFSPPVSLHGSSDIGIILSRRIASQGRLAGVAVGAVRLEYFDQLARRLAAADGGSFGVAFALLDNDLNMMARYPDVAGATGKQAPRAERLAEWVNGRSSGYRVFASPLDGIERGYNFHRLDTFPFIVIVGVPEQTYFGNWQFKAAAYVIAFVLLMAFMLTMTWRSWLEAQLALAVRASTQRRQTQDEQVVRLLHALSRPMTLVRTADWVIVAANPASADLTGHPVEAMIGQPLPALFLRHEHESDIVAAFAEHQMVTDYELKFRRPTGESLWIALSGSTLSFRDEPTYFISLADISERKHAQEVLWRRATQDPLTGIANRGYFMERAQLEWARASRYHHGVAVLMLDLDHFKRVNDTHGHDAGDVVLRGFAERVRKEMRGTDLFGRLGGEEFALLAPEDPDRPALNELAERLRLSIARTPFALPDGGALTVTVSIGVAMSDADTASFERLLKRADEALYAAKAAGRNQVVFYAPS
jgi:diguanylate cyclase (GGDEF)-like protein/PAS domain S-box-containing protein